MQDLICELQDNIYSITLNQPAKHNAFDEIMLKNLQHAIKDAIEQPAARVVVLKANGKHFSAGADVNWMQKMVNYSEADNLNDALVLARVMHSLYHCPKPTIAMVQGAAYGGGAGLVAACDIAIAAQSARFCFSEVKLGLIPAVISPFVIQAIGKRQAKCLFMSAEVFDALRAKALSLIQYCVNDADLAKFTEQYACQLTQNAPLAVAECKTLINQVSDKPIDVHLLAETAAIIAKKRISAEAQHGLHAFLNHIKPSWD